MNLELRKQIKIGLIDLMKRKRNIFLVDLLDCVAPLNVANLPLREVLVKEMQDMLKDGDIKLDRMFSVVFVKDDES